VTDWSGVLHISGTRVFMGGGNEIAGIFMCDREEETARNALALATS